MLLIALNEGFDRKAINILLFLGTVRLYVSGDGLLECAGLIASGLVHVSPVVEPARVLPNYGVSLSERGRLFVEAWKSGDQKAAISLAPMTSGASALS